jgi:predicted alpha/beta hydrolase family esterase
VNASSLAPSALFVSASALPFRSIVAASRNDPLAGYERVAEFARNWGSKLVDLGEVGHLNPASGYGDWAGADSLIAELIEAPALGHNPALAVQG